MPPKFNRRRAVFVLGKIDEILAWEQRKETERDTKFVELGRYLMRGAGGTVLAAGESEVVSTNFWKGGFRNRGGRRTT